MGAALNMKVFLALLLPTAILASTLKPQKETYASFAKRNGIPLPKVDAQYQFADCWDYSNQQGQSVRITDYTPNLGNNANRFSSCCYYGIWLMYDDIDYNSRNTNAAAYSAWGENYYDNFGRSAIVTGYNPWTVYQYTNYQGGCACLYPSDTSNGYPGFYKDLGQLSNQINSARKGCYCSKQMVPAPTASRNAEPVHSDVFKGL